MVFPPKVRKDFSHDLVAYFTLVTALRLHHHTGGDVTLQLLWVGNTRLLTPECIYRINHRAKGPLYVYRSAILSSEKSGNEKHISSKCTRQVEDLSLLCMV